MILNCHSIHLPVWCPSGSLKVALGLEKLLKAEIYSSSFTNIRFLN